MKIIFTENQSPKYHLFVAALTHSEQEMFTDLKPVLSENDIQTLSQIGSEKRRKEWLGVRLLLKEIIGRYSEIFYDDYGKPFLNEKFKLSVSHTANLVAILLSTEENPGVDIEKISERIISTAHKFTSKPAPEAENMEEIAKFFHMKWSAKETLYKIYGKGIPDYKENLDVEINSVEKRGRMKGTIKLDEFCRNYDINYLFLTPENNSDQEFILTWSA